MVTRVRCNDWRVIILAATPIGNLGDASRRLVEALDNAEVIASEDTRVTIHLMRALGIENRPRLIALHEHNEVERAAEIAELARDTDVLVLTDAGMPAISDPGFAIVTAAAAAGITVTALPGPSAVITALALSGLPTDRFTFEGFLPRKGRLTSLRQLAREPRTMVFFESPNRLADALGDIATAAQERVPMIVAVLNDERYGMVEIGNRADVYTTLEAIFVKRHEHALIFEQAFALFFRAAEDWKSMLDSVPLPDHAKKKPPPASRRRHVPAGCCG